MKSKKTTIVITSIVLFGLLMTTTVYAYEGNLWQGPKMGEGMGHKLGDKAFGPGMKLGVKKGFVGEMKDIGSEILGLTEEEFKAKIDSGMTMKDIIEEAGYTQETFRDAMHERMSEDMRAKLEVLVEEGKITEEEMLQKLEAMEEGREWKQQMHEKTLAAQAELLDMSVDELKAALESGKKLADLVEEAGFTLTEFHEKMAERRKAIEIAHLQDLLAEGKITQEEYDKKLEFIENGKMPGKKPGNRMEGIKAPLQELVDEGVITSEQLEKILEKLQNAKPEFNGEKMGKFRGKKMGRFMGRGGQGKFMGAQAFGNN